MELKEGDRVVVLACEPKYGHRCLYKQGTIYDRRNIGFSYPTYGFGVKIENGALDHFILTGDWKVEKISNLTDVEKVVYGV